MKVLWLAPHPIPNENGMHPAPWITTLANKLHERGVSLTILTTGKKLKLPMTEFDLGTYKLIIIKVPSGYIDVVTFFSKRIDLISDYLRLNSNKFDLIHVHGTEQQYASSIIRVKKKGIHIPYVISIQGLLFKYKQFINDKLTIRRIMWELGSLFEKNEIKKSNNFFCRTSWDMNAVRELNPDAKVYEVWEMLRSEFSQFADINFSATDILFSGGSNSLKGLDRALRTFDKFAKEHNSVLNVIGNCSWNYIADIKSKYNLQHLNSDNVKLHGLVDSAAIIQIFKSSFCLYHPSLIDNSPNSVCEAQLFGLPVLASKVGGVGSLIQDGITGILLPVEHSDDFLALDGLFKNDTLRKSISKSARLIALERHNNDSIVDNVISGYKDVINQKANV